MAILQDEIAKTIEHFVRENFRVLQADPSFTRDADLYDLAFVDSVGAVELISFIESTFKVKLEDEHIFSESFTSINGISGVVAQCLPKT